MKEAWQLTRAEFERDILQPLCTMRPEGFQSLEEYAQWQSDELKKSGHVIGRAVILSTFRNDHHRTEVVKALQDGKAVPCEVMLDYPELLAPVPSEDHQYAAYLKTTDNPTDSGYVDFLGRMAVRYNRSREMPNYAPITDYDDFTHYIEGWVFVRMLERSRNPESDEEEQCL
jgi:hypothetical protein